MAPMGFDRIAKNYDIVLNMTSVFDLINNTSQERFIRINQALIDDEFYVDAFWDEFYVPACYAFQSEHYIHNYVMYGYDQTYFYFAGYAKNGIAEQIKLSYDGFYNAAVKKDTTEYILRKYNKNYMEEISPEYIAKQMYLYISGKADYYDGDTPDEKSQSELILGIDCMKFFIDQIDTCNIETLDMAPMRTFLDHKNLMRDRIKYLYDYLKVEGAGDINELQDICKLINTAYLLALKSQFNKDHSANGRISDLFRAICDREQNVYPVICQKIAK